MRGAHARDVDVLFLIIGIYCIINKLVKVKKTFHIRRFIKDVSYLLKESKNHALEATFMSKRKRATFIKVDLKWVKHTLH